MRRKESKRGRKTLHDLQRRRALRQPKHRALIVCEGGKTEPTYFRALCRDKGLTGVQICPPFLGTHPSDVIDCAVQLRGAASKEKDPFERVWCVFHRDEHEKIHEALLRARDRGIEVAFSSPCFELWFLLHVVAYSSRHLERHQAKSRLKQELPGGYDESMEVYNYLLPYQQQAIENAQRLRKYHEGYGGRGTENPSTSVDLLVVELNKLAET